MNFENMTTDELADQIPENENQHWEFKDAIFLTKDHRKQSLVSELGKQVSGLANSGGGQIVFGINDKTHEFQSCEQMVGRQPMREFLVKAVQQSVEPQLNGVRVHRIPFAKDSEQSVFVVVVPDSPLAPHQSSEKGDRRYYARTDFNTEPAPHFYIELLRSRYTRAVLKITRTRFVVDVPVYRQPHGTDEFKQSILATILTLKIYVEVKNISLTCADKWGVLVNIVDSPQWSIEKDGYAPSGIVRPEVGYILPEEKQQVCVPVSTIIKGGNEYLKMVERFESLRVEFRPVSQDFVGETEIYDNSRDPELQKITSEHFRQQYNALKLGSE